MSSEPTQEIKSDGQGSNEGSNHPGRLFAEQHTRIVIQPEKRILLIKQLDQWKSMLEDAYQAFKIFSETDLTFSRSAEWMLDNYFLVEEAFYEIEEDLPNRYINQLPKFKETNLDGHPRMFALARELVRSKLGQLDLANVIPFVQDYQQVAPLSIGELWAFPDMLRVSTLELLAETAVRITGVGATSKRRVNLTLSRSTPPPGSETIVANCFLNLRLLSTTDWKQFFEQTSQVEQILRQDPAGVYTVMDFDTRNNYRKVVEDLARYSNTSEEAVADTAIKLAKNIAHPRGKHAKKDERKSHVGYYLVGEGLANLEKKIGYRPQFSNRVKHSFLAHPTLSYLGSILFLGLSITAGLLVYAALSNGTWWQLLITGLLGFGLALEVAVNLVHWIITHNIPPQSLPRLDFSKGIPGDCRTMVVIPTLLSDTKDLESQLQELELHYLRNPDPHLTFAMLFDFMDAPAQHMPGDDSLLTRAKQEIENLNNKYKQVKPFYLFHRERIWNPSERVWMGWERKRGKLAEFNLLVLGSEPTSYTTQIGDLSILHEIRYVITLDADTSLPQNSAARMIATLVHPLNRAEIAADGHTIRAGYTILQPRVEIKPTSTNRSPFSRIFAGNTGFDLYTLAVSDVYQDFFKEGSYVGKGIYDVAAFEKSTGGKVGENTLLSHDLLEGLQGRAALVTDVILYEEYPPRYLDYAQRMHRWIRGDWQLLPWLFPFVHVDRKRTPNRLTLISHWKIFDNLRRSLLPPTILAFFICAWLILPGSPLLWTVLVLLAPAIPLAVQTLQHASLNSGQLSLKSFFGVFRLPILRWFFKLAFLPFESVLNLSAISITLIRLSITRRHLLQWTPSAQIAQFVHNTRLQTWLEMAAGPVLAVIVGFTLAILRPTELPALVPLLFAWFISPEIAHAISKISLPIQASGTESQRREIERLARRTWAFFERFVGPDDHWLPPDHYQEKPFGITAHYTTPTNIGFYLLSVLAAFDLGYIGLFEIAIRLRNTFENLEKLERYRGHLFNWYDTRTFTPLLPRYVSTVDSGNLAACLISFKQGCLAVPGAPLVGEREWKGVLVILENLDFILKDLERKNPGSILEPFRKELVLLHDRVAAVQNKPVEWMDMLKWLLDNAWNQISQHFIGILQKDPHNLDQETLGELEMNLDTLHLQWIGMQRNLNLLAPWLRCMSHPPRLFSPGNQSSWQPWKVFLDNLPLEVPTLGMAGTVYKSILQSLSQLMLSLDGIPRPADGIDEAREWCLELDKDLQSARERAESLILDFSELAKKADLIFHEMDFRFLFDENRRVFHIGYDITREAMDRNYYDLLASEARVASLVAIAKGDAPYSHWEHLGRPVTKINGSQVLLSWGGTMFEYLMPTLLMRNYAGTFLHESCRIAIDVHIEYAAQKHTPWGISESGFYAFDANSNYQYHAFGVPELGYKRGQAQNTVIAPYASLLGLSLKPQAVLANLLHFEKLKMLGRYGLYEALDYTPSRLAPQQEYAIVQSYMAHHQGMILLSAANYLDDDAMIQRFHADEHIQSVELLLQEKVPQNPPIEFPHPEEPEGISISHRAIPSEPWRVPVDSPIPQLHSLSRGNYSVLITNSGGGFSQWNEFALTRWESDTTRDNWGTWIYLQDLENDSLWSVTGHPVGHFLENPEVLFHPHKVEFHGSAQGISIRTEVTIAENEVEIRRITLLNDTDRARRLRITSYGEVVLAPQAADRRHPAFNKLFIENEYLHDRNILLFHRRLRSRDEKQVYLAHALVIEPGQKATRISETDRNRFLGRGRTPRAPALLTSRQAQPPASSSGSLDPIFSLSQDISLRPHARTQVVYLTAANGTRSDALEQVKKFQSLGVIDQAFEGARSQSEEEMAKLELTSSALENIEQLLSALFYPNDALRSNATELAKNTKGQPGLWAYGISGDYPILLVHVLDRDNPLLSEATQAYSYWRSRHIKINLVILNDQDTGYAMELQDQIHQVLTKWGADAWLNQREGIFLLRSDQVPGEDRILLETFAGVILDPNKGTLADHAKCTSTPSIRLPAFTPSLPVPHDSEPTPSLDRPTGLLMDNGLGGFDPGGKEYVIFLKQAETTPRPWVNVIANPGFGFLASETGSGFTWAGNSGENRLTPWRNDPVSDGPGEALYLRDEETALVWSPTPLPAGTKSATLVRHGAGYSTFESQSHGLNQRLRIFAAVDSPVKIVHLRLENLWSCTRRITATYYAEWVLGTHRDTTQAFIVPEFDPALHALFVKNRYNQEFSESVAFLAANKKPHGLTADRNEFIGRLGDLKAPAALGRIGLASTVRAGLDPCAAIQLHVDLNPGQVEEIYFLLGEGKDERESKALISRFQAPGQVELVWQSVHQLWDDLLGKITVNTPEPGMDLMLNRWLLYQAVSCRLWGRTGLYQSSGAFGFRDQLQDVLALLHTRPDLAREQILNASHSQFEAGDVLHWWHPPSRRGVRTRFSDDLLWLPFVSAEYVATTGDSSILQEKIPFLEGEALSSEEDERYGHFDSTSETYTLYEHCKRAVEKGSTAGSHGLPLMGSGDWNDGMNKVGGEGRGESVWLGWFLHATLHRVADLCVLMGDDPEPYRKRAKNLAGKLESQAWDGGWYLRAFYDDGTPLGSNKNDECRIDSIAQSWAVLSAAADPVRAARAMKSVDRLLVRRADHLIQLFTPPFDKTIRNPGYIKGYPPGVRENGGQYTHAAVWVAWAFAMLGQGDHAGALFRLLNPIHHADTPYKVDLYKAEPYSIAADIYSQPPNTGSGGWTWYTGSAAWMYRLGIEAILGITRVGNTLKINPCIPNTWPGFQLTYRFGRTPYLIHVENPDGIERGIRKITMNGIPLSECNVPLTDDGMKHDIHVVMGKVIRSSSNKEEQKAKS